MEKFWVKVNLQEGETAGKLTKAIFQDSCEENKIIKARKKENELEVYFQEPPMSIIETISEYRNFELVYEKNVEKEEKTSQEEKGVRIQKVNRKKVRAKSIDINPKIKEIAKKATSFSEFAILLVEGSELSNTQKSAFEAMVVQAAEMKDLTWEKLEKSLQERNIVYNSQSRRQISNALKKYDTTVMPFLKTVGNYQKYFKQVKENTRVLTIPVTERLKKAFVNLDRTQSVEERVQAIFNAMGLEGKTAEERKQIIEFATETVKKNNMAEDELLTTTNIQRVAFSNFLNEYVSKNGGKEKVKALDFLKELQKVIMRADEL